MDLVVDANVLFAALIKDSVAYNFLFNGNFNLFTPEFIFEEFEKHKEFILEKTERSTEDFFRLLEIFKKRIVQVPLDKLVPYTEKAEIISPDPKDVAYFALALKLNCAIWSNDKKLKEEQNVLKVYQTHELKHDF
jgi:predicted nucleic acid-binding protein